MDATTFPNLAQYVQDNQCPISEVWVSFTINPPTSVLGLTDISLYPGRVDATAVEFFAHGYCVLLAVAMHERSGWPLVAFKRRMTDGSIYPHAHMVVEAPDGKFLDIYGTRSYLDIREEYGEVWSELTTVEKATQAGSIHPKGWASNIPPIVAEVIRYFADQLVTQTERSCSNP